MNSRDPELEIVLDMSRKEAERAGIITDGDQETGDGRRKRKRVGDPTDPAERCVYAFNIPPELFLT